MKKFIKKSLKVLIILVVICVVGASIYVFNVASAVSLNKDVMTQENVSLKIYDKNGNEITLCGYKNNLTYEQIPSNLINAFVCVEDKNFFNHSGVDFLRVGKAIVKNIISLSPNKEGASTITQQFIKNTHLSLDKTVDRKIQEAKLALDLERNFSKEEIITAYFNILYFGNSIYGVSSACETFFGKKVEDISLSECAILAGVVKNPSKYSPMRNLENSTKRRNFILSEMYKDSHINEIEYKDAISEEVKILDKKDITGLTFINAVIDEACAKLGINEKELAYGNYKIYTSYDANLQKKIELTLNSNGFLQVKDSENKANGFVIVSDNETCTVSAYYNSYPCNVNEFFRQPGSTIKPFVSYLPVIARGDYYPASPVFDEKIDFNGYSPRNFGNKYYGWTNMRTALSKSLNSIAVKLLADNGVERSLEYAKKYGFEFLDDDYNLATALGGMTKGVNPIQITSAYMTLANGGYYKELSFISKILSSNNNVIYDVSTINFKSVESEENVYLITDMLMDCASRGTASRLNVKDYQVASKTGTVSYKNTSKNNDIWNISYTTENTVCAWMGNVDNSEGGALDSSFSAGVYPTEIVKNVLAEIYKAIKPLDFPRPKNIIDIPISKIEYEQNHILLKASEYSQNSEIFYDLFNGEVLETENKIPKDSFDKLNIEIVDGSPVFKFNGLKNVKYKIFKNTLLAEETEVCLLNGEGEILEYKDKNVIPGLDYVYRIEAYIINYNNEYKLVGRSKEFFVSLPYNFWGEDYTF